MRPHRAKANENAERDITFKGKAQNVVYTKQKRILFKSRYNTETEIIVSFRYAFSLIEYSFSLPSGLIENIKKFINAIAQYE